LQMLHHAQPFTIEVVEAPEPDDSKSSGNEFV
jgi:hypothetical protein